MDRRGWALDCGAPAVPGDRDAIAAAKVVRPLGRDLDLLPDQSDACVTCASKRSFCVSKPRSPSVHTLVIGRCAGWVDGLGTGYRTSSWWLASSAKYLRCPEYFRLAICFAESVHVTVVDAAERGTRFGQKHHDRGRRSASGEPGAAAREVL
jgi:hypothetical protein